MIWFIFFEDWADVKTLSEISPPLILTYFLKSFLSKKLSYLGGLCLRLYSRYSSSFFWTATRELPLSRLSNQGSVRLIHSKSWKNKNKDKIFNMFWIIHLNFWSQGNLKTAEQMKFLNSIFFKKKKFFQKKHLNCSK